MRHFVLPHLRSIITICVLFFLFASGLKGQDVLPDPNGLKVLKNLTLEELSKVELTSVSKEATEAFRTSAAISVLTRVDIERSGATTLPDLLRLVPGVEVAQISSNKWAVGIRGFQGLLSKSALVLINGRSVYTPLFAGVYWEMQDALIEDIERIEIIRGPGGTIWGANAVNGVINIITRSAMDTRGAMITALGGNVEQGSLGVRFGAGDDHLAYRVWAKGFTRSPQFHWDGRNFDDWRRGQLGFRMDWNANPRDSVTISGGAYAMEAGSKVAISTFSPPALINIEDNGDFYGQHLVTGWRRIFSAGSDIQLRAYFDRTDRRDLNYRETRDTVDLDFTHHYSRGTHSFISGLGYRVSPSRFFQTVPSVVFTPLRETYSIYSAFAQDSISFLSGRLTAVVGSKFEHNSYSGFEWQPTARLSWTPTDQQTAWIAFTRAVRTPSRIEEGFNLSFLANPAVPLYLRLIGDSQFESEELLGYEAGYRTYIKKIGFIGINGFYNRYDDLLSVESQLPVPETDPAPAHLVLPLFLRNGITAQTKGVEITSLFDVTPWWRLKSSYSHVHLDAGRDATSNDASTVNQLQGDSPQHKVVIQSNFQAPGAFDVNVTYRYVSAIPNQAVASYSTGDARIAKKLSPTLELSAVGQNLFQPRHAEYGGLPGGPVGVRRSGYLKLVWTHQAK